MWILTPDGIVTREQLASFIYRYAKEQGRGFAAGEKFELNFSDAASVSTWATEAMQWCVKNGIVTGTTDTTLTPAGTANRGQIVTMLYRFFNL
ncbi:MAG: S-layer homology domain-containing protein [Clostridia bacterium]|nr:S-layer homology domain-containing protein [Clostridia bacterium]